MQADVFFWCTIFLCYKTLAFIVEWPKKSEMTTIKPR